MAGGILFTASGSKAYIGPSVNIKTTNTVTLFQALTPWTEIGLIQTFGNFGDSRSDITGAAVGDDRVRHIGGANDAGSMDITCFHDTLDVGQQALVAAQATRFNFAFKIVLPDAPDANGTPTTYYFGATVRSKQNTMGGNDTLVTRVFSVGINTQLYEVAAASGS